MVDAPPGCASSEWITPAVGDVLSALTPRISRLSKISEAIALAEPAGNDLSFTHALLCQLGLPRSKFDGERFKRETGESWLIVQRGVLDEGSGPVLQPIPYGAIPRLALIWISTYAVRHRIREVPIGHSANQFLRNLGLDSQGNRHRTLRKQMHALAACRIQFGYRGRTFTSQPVEQFDAWLSSDGRQRSLWPGVLTLTKDYYEALVEHPVPLDARVIEALHGSALALDIYAWLTHRLYRTKRTGTIPWQSLREQFGDEYGSPKNFRHEFRAKLQRVLGIDPSFRVEQRNSGLAFSRASRDSGPDAGIRRDQDSPTALNHHPLDLGGSL